MLASTKLKCAKRCPYGLPGVPSTMYEAYSGRHNATWFLKNNTKLAKVAHSTVASRLDYCYIQYYDMSSANFTKLQRIQNTLAQATIAAQQI